MNPVWGNCRAILLVCTLLCTGAASAQPLYSEWANLAHVHFNTTSSGVSIGADVDAVPLLITLTSDNFDFNQAGDHGEDLRFSSQDRTSAISFEIERWDRAEQLAEIWVRVPRIRANDNQQYICMHWGRSGAASESNGSAVFSAADGFRAVYHLSDPVSNAANGYRDATGNGIHARGHNMDATTRVEGPIGFAHRYDNVPGDPTSRYISVDSDKIEGLNTNSLTIAFGVREDGSEYPWGSGFMYRDNDWHIGRNDDNRLIVSLFRGEDWQQVMGSIPLSVGNWRQVVVTYDSARGELAIYSNGVRKGFATGIFGAPSFERSDIATFGAGWLPDTAFDGCLEEIEISNVARSADWIKLNFESQSSGNELYRIYALPRSITLSRNSLAEGRAAGSLVGTLSTVDPDPDDSHSYALVSGAGSGDNGSFTLTGNELRTAEVFDHDVKSSYSIRVKSTDNTGHSVEATFTITVEAVGTRPDISYPGKSVQFVVDRPIPVQTPTISGDIDSVIARPPLPTGLMLSKASGVLSGTPTLVTPAGDYHLIAINGIGRDTFTMSIEVLEGGSSGGDTKAPENLTQLSLSATSATSIAIRWNTPESNDADADSVLLYLNSTAIPTPDNPGQKLGSVGITTLASERLITKSGLTPRTRYFVALWIADTAGNLSAATVDSVTTPASDVVDSLAPQRICIFTGGETQVSVFNGAIILKKADLLVGVVDTIDPFTPELVPGQGLVVCGQGFLFRQHLPSAPFFVGIKVTSVPAGTDTSSLRIYRPKDGELLVEYGSFYEAGYVWLKTSDLSLPFVLLADLHPPVVTIEKSRCDTGAVIAAGIAAPTVFTLSDNIANASWRLLYGCGNTDFSESLGDTLKSLTAEIDRTIPGQFASAAYGLRALLIVSDGVYTDSIDLSRQVWSESAEELTPIAGAWTPARATAVLDNPSTASVFAGLTGGKKWTYDKSRLRIFRWSAAKEQGSGWQEYSESAALNFALEPGRLLWLKSAGATTITAGSGTTLSLKQPQTIVLKARAWTDFSLPFKFDVRLKDILSATGQAKADSLLFYRWTQEQNTFFAEEFYIPFFFEYRQALDTLTLRHGSRMDGYTVYNAFDHDVTLRIPPIPPALAAGKGGVTKQAAVAPAGWTAQLRYRQDGDPRTIFCGYAPAADARPTYMPLPPSFASSGGAVIEPATRKRYAHCLAHQLSAGGQTWEIALYNDQSRPSRFQYSLDSLRGGEDGLQARIYDPRAGGYLDAREWVEVDVPATSSHRLWLIVGSQEYLAHFQSGLARLRPQILAAWPNPVQRAMTVRYQLPAIDFREVRLALFDLQGRRVHAETLRDNLIVGENRWLLNISSSQATRLGAGSYLLRLDLVDVHGTLVRIGEQKITVVP